MNEDLLGRAENYLRGMDRRDLEQVGRDLAPDVRFQGPLAQSEDKEGFLRVTEKLFGLLQGVDLKARFAEGNQTLLVYDMRFPEPLGLSRAFNWMTFEEGRIKTIEVLYDPRPFEKFFQSRS